MYLLIDSFAPAFEVVNMPVRITRQNYYNCPIRRGDKKGIFLWYLAKKCVFFAIFAKNRAVFGENLAILQLALEKLQMQGEEYIQV